MNKWTRRAFIATGGVAGGGLAIGLAGIAFAPNRIGVVPEEEGDAPQLTTWIRIAADNTVTAIMPHCEMGQGAHTALAMMLAEELEADWNLVRIEEAPADSAYANGYLVRIFLPIAASVPKFMERSVDYASFKLTQLMDLQVTGGSSSVRGTGQLGMRVAGAAAKSMLLEAAAKRWNVPASECAARLSHVTHAGFGSHRVLRRTRRRGGAAGSTGASDAQTARAVFHRRQGDAALRHSIEGQRRRDLRDRCGAARNAVRHRASGAGLRCAAQRGRPESCGADAGRCEGRPTRERSRSRRRWLLARAAGDARPDSFVQQHGPERSRQRRQSLRRIAPRSSATTAIRCIRAEMRRKRSALQRRRSKPSIARRFSRTRPWSP